MLGRFLSLTHRLQHRFSKSMVFVCKLNRVRWTSVADSDRSTAWPNLLGIFMNVSGWSLRQHSPSAQKNKRFVCFWHRFNSLIQFVYSFSFDRSTVWASKSHWLNWLCSRKVSFAGISRIFHAKCRAFSVCFVFTLEERLPESLIHATQRHIIT